MKRMYTKKEEILTDMMGDYVAAIEETMSLRHVAYGQSIVIVLDNDRRMKMALTGTNGCDVLDALELTIVSKTRGQIDREVVPFRETFAEYEHRDVVARTYKRVWERNDHAWCWSAMPSSDDIGGLTEVVAKYLQAWL